MTGAFDAIAHDYDRQFTDTLIGRAQREIVWRYLRHHVLLDEGMKVLELNCGTGEDALFLARQGHSVLATDASPAMLDVVRSKASGENLASRISTSFFDMNTPQASSDADDQYDVIFSNFGGINCVTPARMRQLLSFLSGLLRPGGRLVLVVMGRFCLWESAYFLFNGNLKKAFRRFSKGAVVARVGAGQLSIWYYHSNDIHRQLPIAFRRVGLIPTAFCVPPSYLESTFGKRQRLFRKLEAWDRRRFSLPAFAHLADHYLIDFQKKVAL